MKLVHQSGVCVAGLEGCIGDEFCLHRAYQTLSVESMRTIVQFGGFDVPMPVREWCETIRRMIKQRIHPALLRASGITAPLLAFCGITIEELVLVPGQLTVNSHYYLEDLITGLQLTFDDLLLLGFNYPMLARPFHFPLIALYDHCAVRAEHIFAFDMSYVDFDTCVLQTDKRYAQLLSLNLPVWQSALS